MSRHREALRRYVLDVTRDLIFRGVIRNKQGQRIEEIFAKEITTVLREIEDDLLAVATDTGARIIRSATSALETLAKRKIVELLSTGQETVLDAIFGSKKPK